MPKGSYVPLFRRCADAETSASQPPVTASSPGFSTQTLKRSGTLKWILAAIIVVLAAGVFAVRFLRPVHHGAIRSVVVLPFVNRGAGSGDEYISDSLTDEVTNDLSRETPLQVVGRTSAFTYKGKAADVRQIGKTLSVDAVVEGSLRRDEGKLRMTVQIVGTADGYQRWSGSWERPASELFRLRDDVASAVVSALRPGSGSGHEHSVQTRDVWAFDSYLLGRFYSNKLDPKSLRTAIKYYEKAIAADPRFAAAWAGLATARSLQYVYADDDEEIDKARTAAYQALKIEPESSEAAAALAWIKGAHDYDWAEAERLYRKALAANPNDAAAHSAFGITHLAPLGRLQEALREVRRAYELDPLSLRINNALALCYYYLRQYDESIDQLHKTIQMDSNFVLAHLYLGYAYVEKGMYSDAIDALHSQPTQVWEGPNLGAMGYVYARSHKPEEVRKLMRIWQARAPSMTASASAGSAVWFYLGLGQTDEVFYWLDKAVNKHWFWVNSLKIRPIFDPIRSDARYRVLLRKMNIPE